MKLDVELTDELVEAVAARVAEMLAEREPTTAEAWIGVEQAAEHLGCPRSRVYALCSTSPPRIPVERDGSRLLFRRSELDAFVRRGGAKRP